MSTLEGLSVMKQLDKILDEYAEKVNAKSDKIMKQVSKETVQDLQTTSPRRPNGGAYARSWAVKKVKGSYVVHNKEHYRLTHLLNNDHDIYNKYGGPFGQRLGDDHIGKVERRAVENLFRKLNEALRQT